MDEREDFVPRSMVQHGVPVPDARLRLVDGLLRVEVTASPFGMPRRWRRPPAVRLARGEWVRWRINYRFAHPPARGGAWSYRLDTLNLGYGSDVDAVLFLGTPTYQVDERAPLW